MLACAVVSGCQWFVAHSWVIVSGIGNGEPGLLITVLEHLHSSTDVDGTAY